MKSYQTSKKSINTSLKLIILLFFSLSGCKKDDPEIAPILNYMSSKCKISSYTYNEAGYRDFLTKYNSDNQLIETFQYDWPFKSVIYRKTLEYQNGQLKRIVRPFEELDGTPVPSKNFIEAEYEYGKYGIEKIHSYTSVKSQYNRPNNIMEIERIEFQYNGGDKPVGLRYYINFGTTEDKFMLGLTSNYEYDSNGNLSKEVVENTEVLGPFPTTNTRIYYYDDKINTIKQLNYIYFGPESGKYVFSTNNLIRQQLISSDNEVVDVPFVLNYDSANNATKFPYSFSNVVWDCK